MKRLERAWYDGGDAVWVQALRPLSAAFAALAARRRRRYASGRQPVYRAPVPVIVVGNISVGGTGKTPLVIWLARALKAGGWKPGIVSRGVGARVAVYPHVVDSGGSAREAGDEALLIARNARCPVVIAPDRPAAVRKLLDCHDCDVVLSDDGLQHYALARDIEIAVVDGARGLGNFRCLPAGPLREPAARLREVDFVICNGPTARQLPVSCLRMDLAPLHLCNLATGERRPLPHGGEGEAAALQPVHAVAGIGNPARFFNSLKACGFGIIAHGYPDHHAFRDRDIAFDDGYDIVMTEKDAVKCLAFATQRHWYLKVEAVLPDHFLPALLERLRNSTVSLQR